jgi:cyanophycinase-like exopeptidase
MRLRPALAAGLLLLVAATLTATQDAPKGNLVLIGGGKRPAAVMSKFVELAGGPSARILVVPTASELPDTVDVYVKELAALGATNVAGLPVRGRSDGQRKDLVEEVEKAGGIFFSGGDQRRIVDALRDTPVGRAIEEAWRKGAAIGGTSAGTACMSPLMLTGEGDFKIISSKNVELVARPRALSRRDPRPALRGPPTAEPAPVGRPGAPVSTSVSGSTRRPPSG